MMPAQPEGAVDRIGAFDTGPAWSIMDWIEPRCVRSVAVRGNSLHGQLAIL
jgi:hypothetical protein